MKNKDNCIVIHVTFQTMICGLTPRSESACFRSRTLVLGLILEIWNKIVCILSNDMLACYWRGIICLSQKSNMTILKIILLQLS